MGKPAEMLKIQAAFGCDFADALVGRFPAGRKAHDLQGLGDDVAHRHSGTQRRVRVLENELSPLPIILDVLLAYRLEVVVDLAVRITNLALGDGNRQQKRPSQRRLAGPGLADKSVKLSLPDVDVHAFDGMDERFRP